MDVEDEVLEELENLERLVAGKEQAVKEALEIGEKKGIAKGLQEGLQEGLQKGEKKKAIEIARNCIDQKMDNKTIQQITGLTFEEIDELREP